jgi:hypothetical protein
VLVRPNVDFSKFPVVAVLRPSIAGEGQPGTP